MDATGNETVARAETLLRPEWVDEFHMRLGETSYVTLGDLVTMDAKFHEVSDMASTDEQLVLQKPRRLIDVFVALIAEIRPRRIVEFGIFKGGSVGFFTDCAQSDRYVGIDFGEPVEVLDRWVHDRGLEDRVRLYYGVSQEDTERVHAIVDAEFGDQPLDLVVDDASHALTETRTTFEGLFGRVRSGGVYAIEDWAFGQRFGLFSDEFPPLTTLVTEIVSAWGGKADYLEKLELTEFVAALHKR